MANKTTPGTGPDPLPLEKGFHLVSDILYFFGHQLPGVFSQGMESRALFKGLSQLDDSALEKLGIPRSEIPAYVASSIVPSLEEKPSANREKSDMRILTDWGIVLGAALFATAVMVLFF